MKKQAILHETAVVSSRGQVVLPKPLREAIGVHAGNEIVFLWKLDVPFCS